MQTLLRDLRYGVRSLVKAPGFAAVAILTMALGIGANAAIFSVVNALLIKPLPYAHPGRLVTVWAGFPGPGGPADEWATPGNYADWRREAAIFESLAVITGMRPTLTGAGEPLPVPGEQVSHEYFSVLGIAPSLGRNFTQADDVPNAPRVAIISHGLWTRVFGADRNAVGRVMTLNGEPHEIVGVLPAGFRPIVNATADVWRPLRLNTTSPSRGAVVLRVIARLAGDAPLARAQAAATTLARQLEAAHPQFNEKTGINLIPLHERVVGDVRPGLLALFGAVGFVLLIACSNIANLLLARGSTRGREIAVRIAIGAARARLIRQLLTESLLLSVAGGLCGVLLSIWAIDALVAMAPANTPRVNEIRLDAMVVAFTTLLTLATGIVFGLLPAAQLSRGDVTGSLKDGARGSAGGSGRRLRQSLIVAEVALALVLLTGAGLLLQTFLRLQHADLGFNPANVLTGFVNPPRASYDTMEKHRVFYDQVLEKAALPGITRAALASVLPLSGDSDTSFRIEGRPEPTTQSEAPVTWYRLVSAGYFETMEMPLRRGHGFAAGEAAPSVVVNESFARRYFPGTDPIGHRLQFGRPTDPWFEITGIAADAKARGAREAARIEAFIPYWQMTEPGMNVLVKTGPTPGSLATALKQAVYAIDATVPVSGIGTLEELVGGSIEQPRFLALLAGGFALVALALAAIGLYGLLSYSVAQRRAEIGVRMALGASRREVFELVIGDGLKLAAIGVGAGLAGSLAAMQGLSTLLFGVRAQDPATFAGTSIVLLAVAALAGFVPARRATRVDPIVTLRSE